MPIKIACWNVNSIRARLERLLAWLDRHQPDALCLQETKVVDEVFPREEIEAAGYRAAVHGQKTYNGVAILARTPIEQVRRGFDDGDDDPEARLIAGTVAGIRIISAYVPNGRDVDHPKYQEKLEWLARLRRYLDRESPDSPLVLSGDFNIAPDDRDCYDPEGWRGRIHCSDPERAALAELTAWGLHDSLRLHREEAGLYSWWDYRQLGFPKNRGLRIDQVYISAPLVDRCTDGYIDRDERKGKGPSDHAPVIAEVRDS